MSVIICGPANEKEKIFISTSTIPLRRSCFCACFNNVASETSQTYCFHFRYKPIQYTECCAGRFIHAGTRKLYLKSTHPSPTKKIVNPKPDPNDTSTRTHQIQHIRECREHQHIETRGWNQIHPMISEREFVSKALKLRYKPKKGL